MKAKAHLQDYPAACIDIGDQILVVIPGTRVGETPFLFGEKSVTRKVKLVVGKPKRARLGPRRQIQKSAEAICGEDVLNYSVEILNEIAELLLRQRQTNASELIRSITSLLSRHSCG